MKARRREAILAQRVEEREFQLHQAKPYIESDMPSEHLDDKKKKVISILKRKRANDNEM